MEDTSSCFIQHRRGVIGHDAAAAIIENGIVVAAVEEERLTRVKHSHEFPAKAIRYCLTHANTTLDEVDAICVDCTEDFLDLWLMQERLWGKLQGNMSARQWIAMLFASEFHCDAEALAVRLRFCKHHVAHILTAWHFSGFQTALSVCLDAAGDGPAGIVATCNRDGLTILRSVPAAGSLGYFYLRQIAVLGYRLFDEYKVMGLAPYGDATRYADLFRSMYVLEPNGRYTIASESTQQAVLQRADLLTIVRRKGEAFTELHMDFAAGLQHALESIVMHLLRHFRKVTNVSSLCLSGGVAQNCAMVGQIVRDGLFERVYVPPVAHDAGNALGAALFVARESKVPLGTAQRHAYLGPDIGCNLTIERALLRWGALITYRHEPEMPAFAADLIQSGAVIAWVQSRSEYGPRALGNRSIVADPRPWENKQRINAMVKQREAYRPFAPSVLHERADELFELPPSAQCADYMTIAVNVRPDARALLGAVTHVDGTARIQTVRRDVNPRYYALIEAFASLAGIPVLLNTSFNNNAEPIVDSIDDAVTCFLTTGISYLCIGDWFVQKVPMPTKVPAFLDLAPQIGRHRTLTECVTGDNVTFAIHSTYEDVFGEKTVAISSSAFQILQEDGFPTSLRRRCERIPSGDVAFSEALLREVFDLWQRRVVHLLPMPITSGAS